MPGPKTPFAQQLHQEKYRGQGEDFRSAMTRIAGALSDNDQHFHKFKEVIMAQRFVPAGRVQAGAGSSKAVTLLNCYVMPEFEDSLVHGKYSIMNVALAAASTMQAGGGVGYDFSQLRPRGDLIKKLQSSSSGPVSFMNIFDAVCKTISSSGHRRGAQMAALRCDHPDIEEFVRCKADLTKLTGFNVSVGVTDEFMKAVESNSDFTLRFEGKEYQTIKARSLWDLMMAQTYDNAEPGILFLDTINQWNNLYYLENIGTSNPCAEQPLPPNGACLLGSFNMTKYVMGYNTGDDELKHCWDIETLIEDIHQVIPAMDNVVDVSLYPIDEQKQEAHNKRRMGMGVLGMANAIEAMGPLYGSPEYIELQTHVLKIIRDECYKASVNIAKTKGPFPLFDAEKYGQSKFIKTLPQQIQEDIKTHGIRNSHLLSIAPTGTISMCCDNVSSGIEPVFSYTQDRTIQKFDGAIQVKLEDYAYARGVKGKRCHEVTVDEHLAVLANAQKYGDSSVSKTCNVGDSVTFEEFKDIYMQAWKLGCKGCTTFRAAGKRFGILNSTDTEEDIDEGKSCTFDPATGKKTCE